MEKDFHYYLVYSLAAMTQHPDAEIIAFASQFVDDNNEGQFSVGGAKVPFPDKIKSDGGYYYPIMTQSMSPKSLDMFVQKYVYVPFHFLPGDDSAVIKGKKNKLNTTANSPNAQALLTDALGSQNPYRIGVALHTYADTWSHQNFTGLREDWNSVYPWYDIFNSYAPNIGHAEVGHLPDVISEIWTDHRINQRIVNVDRAFNATREIYYTLRKTTGKGPNWGDVRLKYLKILRVPGYDDRIKAMVNLTKDEAGIDIAQYKKDKWIDAALDKKGTEVVMKPNFEQTDWHKFHQAAKSHFSMALSLIGEL